MNNLNKEIDFKDYLEYEKVVENYNPKDYKKGFFKDEYKRLKNKNSKISIFKDIKRYLVYKDISNTFNLSIYSIDLNFVDRIIYKYGKYYIFIQTDGSFLKQLCKVSRNCSYLCNGQITKGWLKGSKKDRKMLKEIQKMLKEKLNII